MTRQMANLPSPSFVGRGYYKPLSALTLIVMFVFLSSSSGDRRVAPSSSRRSEFTTLELEHNRTNAGRFLLATSRSAEQDHQHQQFLLSSGFHPPANAYQPYFVTIGAAGEHLSALPDGHEDNPLSWLADSRDPYVGRETIFFFVVPKSNGGKLKSIMTKCYNLRRTEQVKDPETLTFIDGVLNIDTQTRSGLAKARANNIVGTGLVDVFATGYFLEGIMLFKPHHRGRAFTILNHPVLRVQNVFLYRNEHGSDSERLSLAEYLESPVHIDNWVVRSLTNDKSGELTEDHFLIAKGILSRKFLIGIAEYFEETLRRLETYYGLKNQDDGGECVRRNSKQLEGTFRSSTFARGSEEWNLIAKKEEFDVMLYYYALELFNKQATTMFKRPYVGKDGKEIDFAEIKRLEMLKNKLLDMIGF